MGEFFEGTRKGRRRDAVWAAAVLLVALVLFLLPGSAQGPLRRTLRATVLRPFIAVQEVVAERRERGTDVTVLLAQRDSLAALVAAEAGLAEENRGLRRLLGLKRRVGAAFVPAEVLHAGTPGAESTFLLSVGTADGVEVGSPVIAAGGLLGVVKDVSAHTAQAIDWTHPDFRASAMTADGSAYGIVEVRRGAFRDNDLLSLTGAPFHSEIPPRTRIVTAGRGGIYPRGIPLGTVIGIEEADTGWRKSYLLQPVVRPQGVTHVLVGVLRGGAMGPDMSAIWEVPAPPDTTGASAGESADTVPGTGRGAPESGTRSADPERP